MGSYIDYVIGAVFVFIYAIDRISNPKMNMDTTTLERYWTMLLLYALCSITIYLIAASTLQYADIDHLKDFLPGLEFDSKLSPPLVVALLMTILLPKISGLVKIDEAVRTELRRRASMSSIASNLSHILESSPLQLSEAHRQEIIDLLAEQEIEEQDVIFDYDGSAQYLWTRITILLRSMRSWETDASYRGFIEKYHDEWDGLIERSELNEAKAIRCFRLQYVAGKDEKLVSALKDCRRHYTGQLSALLTQLCDFMGKAIAQCRHSPKARRDALVDIGINARINVGYTIHQITMVFIMAFVVTLLLPRFIDLISSFLTNSGDQAIAVPDNDGPHLIKPYMFKIAVGYACAGLIALQMHFRQLRTEVPDKNRLWGNYLIAAFIAVGLSIFVGFLIDAFSLVLGIGNATSIVDIPRHFIAVSWIYQIRVLVLCFLLCYLLDSPVKRSPRIHQLSDTLITGTVMLAVGYFILSSLKLMKLSHTPDALQFLSASLVLGALIGYWLPTSARQALEQVPDAQIEHSSDVQKVAVIE